MTEAPKLLEKPSCRNCSAACCRDFILPLNDQEVDLIRWGREDSEENPIDRKREKPITQLVFRGKPNTRGRDLRGYWEIVGLCGLLRPIKDEVTGQVFMGCSVHNTAEQPHVCRYGFPENGEGCKQKRKAVFEKTFVVPTDQQ